MPQKTKTRGVAVTQKYMPMLIKKVHWMNIHREQGTETLNTDWHK